MFKLMYETTCQPINRNHSQLTLNPKSLCVFSVLRKTTEVIWKL